MHGGAQPSPFPPFPQVVIIDTSNEIAGDGDIAHPAVGHSRRMMVRNLSDQANVMIEGVQNHT